MWHFKGDVQVIEESGRKASEIVDQILMEHKNIIKKRSIVCLGIRTFPL